MPISGDFISWRLSQEERGRVERADRPRTPLFFFVLKTRDQSGSSERETILLLSLNDNFIYPLIYLCMCIQNLSSFRL